MANNTQTLYPLGNPQHGQALPMAISGIYGAAALNLPPGNNLGVIPFTYQHFQMNQNKDVDIMQYLNARNNNDNLMLTFRGQMNPPANFPVPNFPQVNILPPNMVPGNVMAFPNLYPGPHNNVIQNNAAPLIPQAPLLPVNPPVWENYDRNHVGPNADEEDMEDNDPDTPGIATPDSTDDESHWTAFDRAIKTRKLLKEALKSLHKADLIDKDAEILHICDLVEVKIKKIYDNLDELDDGDDQPLPNLQNQA
ncbi:hypothetical protein CAEBREN_08034 [Caenorhabditis brenneri]|uniref:Uncharacterized protein n=1 Tax=Caenorhabditis brenneri TaxID=135651 RepID=G0NF97_CAEBE|nr:hypothetical protein CAEBREN_08034 [Caenorhabditis brenneri]